MEQVKNIKLEQIKKTIESDLDGNSQALALSLYNELIFLKDVLDKLKEQINNNGVLEEFKNGKQEFIRESQALKSYNNTIKNYQKIVSELLNVLPKENKYNDESEFDL